MRSRNAVFVLAFIPVVLAVTWYLFLRSPVPDFSNEQAAELGAAADAWYPSRTGQTVPESEWPPAVKRLRPKSVYVTHEGAFLVKEQSGTSERGVFVQPASAFQPTSGGDRSYRLLNDRVYWYTSGG